MEGEIVVNDLTTGIDKSEIPKPAGVIEHGMCGEKRRELERPILVPLDCSEVQRAKSYNGKEGDIATMWESDSFILL